MKTPQRKKKLTERVESSASPNRLKAKEVFVDVNWHGVWYKAEVLAKDGDKSLVHFDGFSSQFDEWVTADRIKLRGTPAPALAPPPVAVKSGFEGQFYRQAVLPKDPALTGGSAIKTFPYLFLPDGHVLGGSWSGVSKYLRSHRVEDFRKDQPSAWGTYRLSERALTITWVGGREEVRNTESQPDGLQISGLRRTWPFPDGHVLKGKYVGLEGGVSEKSSGTAGTFQYVFHENLKYEYSETGVVELKTSTSADVFATGLKLSGTYRVAGNALTITDQNDIKYVQTLWAFNADDARKASPTILSIGGSTYLLKE